MYARLPLFGTPDKHDALRALAITGTLFASVFIVATAYASTVTLSVVVQTYFQLTTTTDNFTTITQGTVVFATTTLIANTNDAAGWNVTLSGDWKSSASGQNLQLFADGATSTIPDQVEWVDGSGTTTAGTAVRINSFANSQNVLAFRVMTASSTNGAGFLATTWWGTADNYIDSANTLWAGIASSTVARKIGNAGAGTYSATAHINTVLYYLKVANTQKTGTYNAPITYTGTGN